MPTIEKTGNQKVKVAVGNRSKKSLYHRCLTTGGFMQLQPLFYREMIPFESVEGNYEIWSRLNPLVTPCFGITNYHFSKFFVRFKDIWKGWDDFYNRSLHVMSANTGDSRTWLLYSPYALMRVIWNIFVENGWVNEVDPTREVPDLGYTNLSNVTTYYQFTDYGAHVNKVFEDFGIELSWSESDTRHYNILPFLALGKIFIDHYWPKQYHNNSDYCRIRQMFETDIANNIASISPNKNFLYLGLESVLKNCLTVFYDNNGFYQAWDRPEGPSDTAQIAPSYNDGPYNSNPLDPNIVDDNNSNAVLHTSQGGGIRVLTRYALEALNRLSNVLKRYQLAGSTWIDHFLANFGYKPADTHLSVHLGTENIDVRVGDVESNSNSEIQLSSDSFVSVLGSLAGKGVAAHGSRVRYSAGSDAGIYIGLISIIPDGDLYQGCDPMTFANTPDDFYQPADDSLGVDAVPQHALLVSRIGADNNLAIDADTPFGFMPHGYRYCISRSILSGAFRNPSQGSAELSAFHLYRDLTTMGFGANTIVHGLDFMHGTDGAQYNRIFYNAKFLEQFIIRFRCKFDSISSKRSLSDSFDWSVDENHKEVVVDGNSVEVN